MISDLAISKIESLIRDGLNPTPRDIVRLNAFGVAIDRERGKRPTSDIYLLPRTATITDGVQSLTFRQPTVGHEVWLDSVQRYLKRGDYHSTLAVTAYALSRNQATLPDPQDPAAVETAVDTFSRECAPFCVDVIHAAIMYVKRGIAHLAAETPPAPTEKPPPQALEDIATSDIDECIALGVMYRGASVLWGCSLAELKTMTRAQLVETIRRASVYHRMELTDGVVEAEGDFYRVFYEIRERLIKEKESSNHD